jgi:hypothetical protein
LVVIGGVHAEPSWILGGTESGFNIPPPVTSLSASYASNRVILAWINPPDGYDSITVVYGGIPLLKLEGAATSFVYEGQFGTGQLFSSTDVTFLVEGCKGGTPSNGAGIRFRNHSVQESLMNIPFAHGIAPSFRAWSNIASTGSAAPEQGELPGMAPGADPWSFRGGGFYQVVRGSGTFRGGVSRTFLGLTAGHAYRASARMNTLQAKDGAWSWSFHARSNPPGPNNLTPEQMAGMAELPDHTKGPTAGRIARYDSATSTKGEWVLRSSGTEGPGKSVGDITLPEGCDSLTLWFRLEGTNVADIAVGFDSVALEDLGKR